MVSEEMARCHKDNYRQCAFRNKDCFGLNLKRLLELYKFLKVSKGYSLKNSKDPKVKEIYEHRAKKQEEKFNNKDFKLEVQEWTCFKSSSSSYQKPYTKMKREHF